MPRIRTIAAGAVLLSSLLAGVATMAPPVNAAVSTTVPSRMLDTRNGIGRAPGIVSPGEVVRVTAPASVSAATSLALNLTAADALEPGFATVWACDEAKPATSNLNFVPGRAVANMAIIRPSASGNRQICLETSAPVHLLVDLMAWFSGSGDVAPTAPNRIVDTRQTRNPLQVGEFRRVRVAGTSGVPANASSALLNVTLTGIRSAGFASVVPCPAAGGSIPSTSTMNFAAGDTVAAFTVAALVNGDVCVYSNSAADLIVDTFGTAASNGGLRVKSPERVLDTRNGVWASGAAGSGAEVKVRVAGRGGVPNESLAALLTVTVSDTSSFGYVTAWPCDQPKPDTSVLNFWPGSARANLALVGTLDGQWRGLSVGLPEQRTARRADRRRGRLRARKRQPGARARSARPACSGSVSRSAWWFGWVRDVAGGCGVAVGCGVCVAGEGGGGDPSGECCGEWQRGESCEREHAVGLVGFQSG